MFLQRSLQNGRKRFSGIHSTCVAQVGHLTVAGMAESGGELTQVTTLAEVQQLDKRGI